MELKDRLKILMDENKVTAYEVSLNTGIEQSTIGRILSGKTKRMIKPTKKALCLYFDVNEKWLISGVDYKTKYFEAQIRIKELEAEIEKLKTLI